MKSFMKGALKWLGGIVGSAVTLVLVIVLMPYAGSLADTLLPDVSGLYIRNAAILSQQLEESARLETLVVTGEVDKNLVLSARNIPGVITAPVNALSVYDILNCDNFVIMKDAVTKLEEVYA